MPNRTLRGFWQFVLCAVCCVLCATRLSAQSSNNLYTLQQDLVTSAGGTIGGGNPMRAQTALGLPAAGLASNSTFRLIGGIGMGTTPVVPPITATVTIAGTVNDASATVTVNGSPATVSGTTFTAANVQLVLGPNTITAVARDALGNTMSKSILIYLDVPANQKTPRFSITVTGTMNDAAASVTVNGIPATVASGQFSASVPLVTGVNTLTATATDGGGNTATKTIKVFVPQPPIPPAMPTVGTVGNPIPPVTTQSSITIGGTKTANTSIWINGIQVVSLDGQTTWTATMSLTEGDNELRVVAKDASGGVSAEAVVNVVVDNLPPVVTFAPPAKTNFNPVTLAGSTDDRLTTVTINGVAATRIKKDFLVSVPLTLGQNTLHVIATSPNGLVTTRDQVITLGTIPSIQSAQPADATILYAGAAATIQVTAADQENDPIEYQVLLDGSPLGNWTSSASQTWTPTLTQSGVHTLSMAVRDAYGGSNTTDAEVCVIRPPVSHP